MGRAGLIVLLALIVPAAAARADSRKFAGEELIRYLKQISPDGELNYTIRVGIDPTLAGDGSAGGGGGETFSIATDHQQLTVTGSNGNMALFGVYHVLDMVGCRFLSPQFAHYQGAAEVMPPKKTFDLQLDAPIVRKPKLKFRKLYVEEGHSHNIENLKQMVEWMPKVGYNTLVVPTNYQGAGRVKWDNWRKELTPELQKRGITIEVGGHGYQNFLNAEMEDGKLFEQHEDWFGQDKNGKRHREKGWVPCTSNPAAVEYLINNFTVYVKDRPEIQIYDFWPPDGAKWCECEQCKKLGTPSDRQAILVGQVKQKVKAVRPDLRLEIIAYASALKPPEHAKLDKDVLVDFCPIGQQFDHQINDADAAKNREYADALSAWRKAFDGDISIYSYYRKYAWDSLPVIIPHYVQKDLQFYKSVPVQGVSTYAEPDDWATYELNHYVLAALAWNPDADVDALVKKFCDARYGDAADVAMKTYAALEEIVRNDCSVPNTSLKDATEIELGRAKLAEVQRAVRAADKDNRPELARLDLMLQYAISDLEIQKMRAEKAPKEEIRGKAEVLHAFVDQHAEDGVFLVKDHRLGLPRMLTRYGIK